MSAQNDKLTIEEIERAIHGMDRELAKNDGGPYGVRYQSDLATLVSTAKQWLENWYASQAEKESKAEAAALKADWKVTERPMYLFLDVETPGLKPELGLLEVGWFVTTDISYYPGGWSKLSDIDWATAYDSADDYVKAMHTKNGLWMDLKARGKNDEPKGLSPERIEELILESIGDHTGPVYLVGNSIRLDRAFIERWMPKLDARLHYRQIDLTSVRLFLEAWEAYEDRTDWSGEVAHRALEDAIDSWNFSLHMGSIVEPKVSESAESISDERDGWDLYYLIGGPFGDQKLRLPRGHRTVELAGQVYSRLTDPENPERDLGAYIWHASGPGKN